MPETLLVADTARTELQDNESLTFLDPGANPESINSFHFKLPAFQGPLDLLLHLIRKQKIDIYDIPIIQITRQYMEYIDLLKELDLEIAGEFLVMAATLIHIKSRMLLPADEEEKEEPVDPREELVRRLLEFKSYQDSSQHLRKREEIWKNVFHRGVPDKNSAEFEPEPVLLEANVFDLISAFQKLLKKAPDQVVEITRESLTVTDRINYIVDRLETEDGIKFEELFTDEFSKVMLLVTFLALLELVKLGLAKIYQEQAFGSIWILKQQQDPEDVALDEVEVTAEGSADLVG